MWTVTFSKDEDKTGVGTLIAVFDYENGESFTYSERFDNQAGNDAKFVTRAKAAKTKYDNAKTSETSIASAIETLLNS